MNINAGTLPLIRDRYDIIGRVLHCQLSHSVVRKWNVWNRIPGKEEGRCAICGCDKDNVSSKGRQD